MKLALALPILIILISSINAETYQLGSHTVSLNLSRMQTNYSDVQASHNADFNRWSYALTISPNTDMQSFVVITVDEMGTPDYSSAAIERFADSVLDFHTGMGVGNMKYGMTTYQGHDAFEYSYPAQTAWKNGQPTTFPEFYAIRYHLDELTEVMIQAVNTGDAVYNEILGSINVTKTTKK
jgi:hypothetical protein